MTIEDADKIISDVGRLVTEAAGRVEFRSGDRATTNVIAGFPFTLVKKMGTTTTATTETEYVAPWFPDLGGANRVYIYSTAGDGGSNVFFLPFDTTTTIRGDPCYDVPPPSFFIPGGSVRFAYLQQTFRVESYEDPVFDVIVVESVTAGPASIFLVEDGIDNIPESDYPGPNEVFQYPGTYTYYFLMARLLGVENAPAQKTTIPGAIDLEWRNRNYGASQMVLGSNPFSPNFANAVRGSGITAGDNAAEGGYIANSYPDPAP